jgi:hypothetical protein
MRKLPTFTFVALAVGLGGCASFSPPPMCGTVADLDLSGDSFPPWHRAYQHASMPHHRGPGTLAVLSARPHEDGPEPRFTSPEWWKRENARLAKITLICAGCLSPSYANAGIAGPGVLGPAVNLEPRPESAINHEEAPIETPSPRIAN